MKEYLILDSGNIIENIIVLEDDAAAEKFGAVPSYDGASIGDVYAPPPPPASHLREKTYNTQTIISFGGEITVTQASQKWQYYAAEGDTDKTDALTALIAEAKASIREQYPDSEVI